ncbi:hypothetical protein Q757_05400, partial [Oenococcus alcoholitolerans]
MKDLKAIVSSLEDGNQPIDKSLNDFKNGVEIST